MKYLSVIILLLVVFSTANAQQRTGYVRNTTGDAIDYATIVLTNGEQQVATAITDSTGKFNLNAPAGSYTIKIRNLAYNPIEDKISIDRNSSNLGIFKMRESAVSLNEVVVSGSAITREADKFVMRILNTPSLTNKNSTELLRLAPGVWVDDNGISINGAGGSKVFINERELKLKGKDLVNYLRSYKSSDIARIEVVPQAGSEYSADTKSGVIKIILNRRSDNGIMGNAAAESHQGKYINNYIPSASINMQLNKLSVNAFASTTITQNAKTEMVATREYSNNESTFFQTRSYMNYKTQSITGRIGAIYDLNKRNSLGAEAEFSLGKTPNPSTAESTIIQSGDTIYGFSKYKQNERNKNLNITLNYVLKLDTLGSTLKFITDYTNKNVSGANNYHSTLEFNSNAIDSVYRSHSSANYQIYTAGLMLEQKLTKSLVMKAGIRYVENIIDDSVKYDSYFNSAWKVLDKYNFSLDYSEKIYAGYTSLSFGGSRLSITAGVRAEYTKISNHVRSIDKSYWDIFPSANLTYSFNTMRTFMLIGQYSQNIERPNFWYLNPNRVQSSDYSYSIGNPALKPTYIKNLGVTAVYKYRYTLSVGGRLHHDLIREVCKTDPENSEITYIIPENHFSENHYYISLNLPLKLSKNINLNSNLVGVRQDIRATKNDSRMSNNLYFINITSGFVLPAKSYLELTYSGTSKLYSANSGINPRQILNLTLKKQWFNDKLNTSVSVNNIFNSKASYFSNIENFRINSNGYEAWNSRHLSINIQYNFNSGKSFKKREIENQSENEKSRLKK